MEQRAVTLILVFVVALAIVGFAFFQYLGTPTEPTEETEEETEETAEEEIPYPAVTPDEVVTAFYEWYMSNENALPSEAYLEAESLTQAFRDRVSDIVAATDELEQDPFVCAASMPEEITTGVSRITGRDAIVVVDAAFSEAEQISFETELDLVDGAWRIDEIICFAKG